MTREEWAILAASLKTMYTYSNFLADEDAFNLWYTFLHDLDYKIASAAVQQWILENRNPPTVADIRKLSARIGCPSIDDWSSGWEEVTRAIHKYGYYCEAEALESMSEVTKETVKRLGWQSICMSENIASDRANFRDTYNTLAERKAKDYAMPVNLRVRLEELQKVALGIEVKDGTV